MKKFFLIFLTSLSGVVFANAQPPKKVAILIYDGVQIIDYTAPYEILSFSFDVFTVAPTLDTVTTWRGMKVWPTYSLADCPPFDILIVPGGDTRGIRKQPEVFTWISERTKISQSVMSVCNGAGLLAKAGLLKGLEVTTTANLLDRFQSEVPEANIVFDKRFVDTGKIITTGGYLSGIEGSLHLISKYKNPAWAAIIARRLEYNWDPTSSFAAGALADVNVYKIYVGHILNEYNGEPIVYEGNKDYWKSETIIQSEKLIPNLLSELKLIIEKEEHWTVNNTSISGMVSWQFTSKDKRNWQAELRILPSEAKKHAVHFSIKSVNQ